METKKHLDKLSPSFCAAKWYNATIWLGSGMTTSCHHPPAHKIDLEEIKNNPSALHNTKQKKEDRQQMKIGERPPGCSYCWKIEDNPRGGVSDRVYKSQIYNEADLDDAYIRPVEDDISLKTLEIAFDRTCNFACSYCNPAFSSTWVRDIKTDGRYEGLTSDGQNHFTHTHDASQLYKPNAIDAYNGKIDPGSSHNPYVEAFFKWWETDLQYTLQELRVTGGEPIMSADFWRLVDWFKENNANPDMRFAVNSNLGGKPELINRLLEAAKTIPNFHLYTSCEAIGSQAEYIRDGLDFKEWYDNVRKFLEAGIQVHVMCTINALCLETLPTFLGILTMMKEKYGHPSFTLNILRFPSFQSVQVFPDTFRHKAADELEKILESIPETSGMERDHVQRLISYLKSCSEQIQLQSDFKRFYEQYDRRRNKNFDTTFSKELVQWKKNI